ncbi:DinB family protein [Turneriella parva]|uniref:DinB family protein n=1 Tax=Turneriella parva (strain ATCC BAA-1111 / DSM 21527 / NCTC 11395 / H) TaxID=869212 RepID=I4B5I9_TURPD|nr:DinB family protein [Turneriella parva]AFM12546.1 DinB family protein [Turneriella parva DSM 21527]
MHATFIKLAKYNQLMNGALYAAVETLTDGKRKADAGAFFGSIHLTLNHILWADKNWLRRFIIAGHGYGRLTAGIYENIQDKISEHRFEIHSDFVALKQDRISVDTKLLTWVSESLSDERLQQVLHYRNAKNEDMSRTFADVLTHLFNHQTHHRGQITTLLSQQGVDVGVTDYIALSAGW